MADDTSLIGRLRASILGATITQRFGCTGYSAEPAPWWVSGLNCQHFHTGVDLVLPGDYRANVYAPASGVVTRVDTNPNVGYGYSVRIRDPQGLTWILGHLSGLPRVSVGDEVQAGTVLGNQGDTGNATKGHPHLHLEVRNAQNVPLNPAQNAHGAVIGSGIRDGITQGDIFYGLGHVFGFGAGPTQGGIQVPPDPVTGGVPASGVTGGTGPGTSSDPCGPFPVGFDVGRMQAWAACKAAQGVSTNAQAGTNANGGVTVNAAGVVTGYVVATPFGPITIPNPLATFETNVKTEFVPLAIVGFAGLLFVFVGFRKLTQEPPVKVVTQPIADVGKSAAGVTTAVAGGIATRGAVNAKEKAAVAAKAERAGKIAATRAARESRAATVANNRERATRAKEKTASVKKELQRADAENTMEALLSKKPLAKVKPA